jgi:hypothetical protein
MANPSGKIVVAEHGGKGYELLHRQQSLRNADIHGSEQIEQQTEIVGARVLITSQGQQRLDQLPQHRKVWR